MVEFDFLPATEEEENGGWTDAGEFLLGVPPSLMPVGELEADVVVFHQEAGGGWLQLEKGARAHSKTSPRYAFEAPDGEGKSIVTIPSAVATEFLCLFRDGYTTRHLRVGFPSRTSKEEDGPPIQNRVVDPADLLIPLEEGGVCLPPRASVRLFRKERAPPPAFVPKGPASWPGKYLVRQGQAVPDDRAEKDCVFADRQLASTPDHRLFQQGTDGWKSEEEVRAACEKPWRINLFLNAQGIVLSTCNG